MKIQIAKNHNKSENMDSKENQNKSENMDSTKNHNKSAPNSREAGQECKADVFETKCDILQFLKWTNMWCIKNIKNALVKYQ